MTDACKKTMSAAVKGAFSQDEIDHLAQKFIEKKLNAQAKNPLLGDVEAVKAAAKALGLEEVKAALQKQRQDFFTQKARANIDRDLAQMKGDAVQKLEALTIGHDEVGFGSGNSADNMGAAFAAELLGDLERGMRGLGVYDRATKIFNDTDFERDVAREMSRLNGSKIEPTENADARNMAKIFNAVIEKSRIMQNEAGAWIGKLDGYIVKQNHDPMKVSGGFFNGKDQARARDRWIAAILPRLDIERTFGDMSPAARMDMLSRTWANIVSGVHDVAAGAKAELGIVAKSGLSRQVSSERVLHFKGPDEWFAYHQEFGRGTLFGAVAKDLEMAGRNVALMRRLGPNPDATWNRLVAEATTSALERSDAKLVQALTSPRLQGAFDQVSGQADSPQNLRIARVGSLLRKHAAVAKLGGMVLSAFSDLPIAANALMRSGVGFFEAYGSALGGITRLNGKSRKEAAQLADVGARTIIGKLSSGLNNSDGALGLYTSLGRANMMLQGFEFWNEGLREGVASMVSHHLANHAGLSYDKLPRALRRQFERFAIDQGAWDKMRGGVNEIDGIKFMDAAGIVDPDAAMKLRMMVQDTLDTATSEARARERRSLDVWPAGTGLGEALRAVTQFMSFPLTYVNRSLAPAFKDAASGGPIFPLVNLILGTTLLGYLSLQAKEITKGREGRPMTGATVIASMIQGGGLGIYGDFLFGEKNRMEGGLLETFGGPLVGDFSKLYAIGKELRDGELGDAATDGFRFVKSQIPLANLWYTRAALDYLIFWRMQEAIDPGWAAKYQAKIERETGSDFWLEPTEAAN